MLITRHPPFMWNTFNVNSEWNKPVPGHHSMPHLEVKQTLKRQTTFLILWVYKHAQRKDEPAFSTRFLSKAKQPWRAYTSLLRLRARKTSLFSESGFAADPAVWQITILPLVLNTLSAGVLVAAIQKYFLANWQTCGELTSCSFHCRGSVSLSAGGALIASVTHSSVLAINFFFLGRSLWEFSFFSPLFIYFFASATAALCGGPGGAVALCSDSLWLCALNVPTLIKTLVHCLFVILQSSVVVLICHFLWKRLPGSVLRYCRTDKAHTSAVAR